jgi:hypothetical protein
LTLFGKCNVNKFDCKKMFKIILGWWVGFGCGWAKLNVVFSGRQVRWQNTSFNFAKRWHFRPLFLSVCCRVVGRLTLACNGFGLGEGGDFYHKC